MFRLLKLAVYALLGYALYEFFRGLSTEVEQAAHESSGGQDGRQAQRQGGQNDFGTDTSRQAMTGGGEGKAEETHNPDGGAESHRVGRGVVHR
ncbi:MAG TPA: hypothetical protein VFC78_22115 [Tepidisphaeraceae bacterium]|nr:hypothetical protein [Tepidisphaeraceae bacterium]